MLSGSNVGKIVGVVSIIELVDVEVICGNGALVKVNIGLVALFFATQEIKDSNDKNAKMDKMDNLNTFLSRITTLS